MIKTTYKNNIIKLLTTLTLTIGFAKSYAQIFDNIQAHPSVKWKQIDSEYFQLIFPEPFLYKAMELADSLQVFAWKSGQDLKITPKKTTLILQASHLEQNGFVQLAPRKSELYPIPSSVSDNQEWLANLALHEFRHIAQFDKLTGKIRGPFFEQLALALFALNLPSWYFEGDATQIETLFSNGGRGRLPSWEMPLRANLLSNKNYSFNKYLLGSFKDNIPSYYVIGYMMNSYLTNHFDLKSHESILDDMRRKLIRPYNFQRSLKAVSGLNSHELFKSSISELAAKWTEEKPQLHHELSIIKANKTQYPKDYLLPQKDENNDLYALRISPQTTATIVKLNSIKGEENILKTGYQISPNFHIRTNEIVWDEYRKDPRFGKQTYNIINIFNLKTGKRKSLTSKTRYYSPTLHPSKNHIAAVEVDEAGISSLIVLDSENGQLIDHLLTIKNTHIQQPRYNESGQKIVAIAIAKQGTNLVEFDLEQQKHKFLLNWDNQQLAQPLYYKDKIIYKAHYNGIDNIYQLSNDSIQQLTEAEYGAFNPHIDNLGFLLYNDYQHNGYRIAKKTLQPIKTRQIESEPYIQATLNKVKLDSSYFKQTEPLQVKEYKASSQLINFHSLSISNNNFENFDKYIPGIFWLSNDLLNTTQMKLGVEYDTDIKKSIYSAELSYRKLLPIFTVKYANRGRIGQAAKNTNDKELIRYDYRDHHLSMEVSIPLSVYRQNTTYSYGLSLATSYTKRYNPSINLKNFNDIIAFPLSYQAYFNKNNSRSKMDILPKWGQNISITYRHLPFENQLSGNIFSIRSNFYFPGFFQNHSLQFRLALQESTGLYTDSYDIPLPSGWGHFNSPIVKNTSMINYRLPIAYPDWSIGSIAYIKRLQGLVFSDFQNIHKSINPKSLGVGISADFNVFRYPLPDINISTRISYINDKSVENHILPTFSLSYTY